MPDGNASAPRLNHWCCTTTTCCSCFGLAGISLVCTLSVAQHCSAWLQLAAVCLVAERSLRDEYGINPPSTCEIGHWLWHCHFRLPIAVASQVGVTRLWDAGATSCRAHGYRMRCGLWEARRAFGGVRAFYQLYVLLQPFSSVQSAGRTKRSARLSAQVQTIGRTQFSSCVGIDDGSCDHASHPSH